MRFAGGFSPDGQRQGRGPNARHAPSWGRDNILWQNLSTEHPSGGKIGMENIPKTQNTGTPHGGQCWLDEMPLTEY